MPKESEFNGKHYVLERIEGADKQVGLNPDENIVNVYYSMDEIGEPDPDEPDNIPINTRSHSPMYQQMLIREL